MPVTVDFSRDSDWKETSKQKLVLAKFHKEFCLKEFIITYGWSRLVYKTKSHAFSAFQSLQIKEAGEATQDLFAADSYGFTNALKWLLILMGISLGLGLFYTCVRCLKKKFKVAPIPGR